jgi:ABC-2 type transport system ATP-binding protein
LTAAGIRHPVVRADALSKRFGHKLALDRVSFTATRAEIVGILGPNGAGKSTLIAILSGLLEPDQGQVQILSKRMAQDRALILARMNLCSPYASLPGQLTVQQNLSFYGEVYGLQQPARRIAHLLETFGMVDYANTRFGKLSSGQAVRICLCKALLNKPELLLLDEPTAYLDSDVAGRVRSLLLKERDSSGMTILLTSHNLAEVEQLCDRIVLLAQGRVAAQGSALEVTRMILGEQRRHVALAEAFSHVANTL